MHVGVRVLRPIFLQARDEADRHLPEGLHETSRGQVHAVALLVHECLRWLVIVCKTCGPNHTV